MDTNAKAGPPAKAGFRAAGPTYMATISGGHGIKHFYAASFAVFLPLIEGEFALSALGVAILVTVRQLGAGLPNFFAGYISDRMGYHAYLLIPLSMLGVAVGYLLAGLSPWYPAIVVLLAFTTLSASFWHPPAISMLSNRFPSRRGMAIAFHGAGSGAGEALGPLVVGAVLTAFLFDDWRQYVIISFLPAVAVSLLIYWLLAGAPEPEHKEERTRPRFTDLFRLLKRSEYRTLAFAHFTRSFAYFGMLAFLPIYLARDLGLTSAGVGAHIALLTILGVAAGPLFGYLSDRIGRRPLLVTAFASVAVGTAVMGIVGSGILFVVALAFIGIFIWSVQDVLFATGMDASPEGNQGTAVGLMFLSGFIGGIIAPTVMGTVVTLTEDRSLIFFVAAAVTLPAALVLSRAPLGRQEQR